MNLFLIQLTPKRTDLVTSMTDVERKLVSEHFQYLKVLLDNGDLFFAGRTNEATPIGLALVQAPDIERAQLMVDADPAVLGGVFNGKVAPYSFALAADRSLLEFI